MKSVSKLFLFLACGSVALTSCSSSEKPPEIASAQGGGGGGAGTHEANGGAGAGPGGTGTESPDAGTDTGDETAKDGAAPDAAPMKPAVVCPETKIDKMALQLLVETKDTPMALVQAPNDDRIFVAFRGGEIRIWKNGKFNEKSFFDLSGSLAEIPSTLRGERGLMNLALHPKFPTDPRFYVFYTARSEDSFSDALHGDIVVAEGKVSQNEADIAAPTLKAFITLEHSEDHKNEYDDGHNGGMLVFDNDGLLYAASGDGGNCCNDFGAGQNADHPLSKIFRIDVDSPPMNPRVPGKDAFAMGVRNPFRASLDAKTGHIYWSDVGEAQWEEINVIPSGTKRGALNYGWGNPGMEGTHCFRYKLAGNPKCEPFGTPPFFEYVHPPAGKNQTEASAVIGGFVYRGKDIGGLEGRYVFGDHRRKFVHSLAIIDNKGECLIDHTPDLNVGKTKMERIVGFGQDNKGELFLLERGDDTHEGRIYKIVAEK